MKCSWRWIVNGEAVKCDRVHRHRGDHKSVDGETTPRLYPR